MKPNGEGLWRARGVKVEVVARLTLAAPKAHYLDAAVTDI